MNLQRGPAERRSGRKGEPKGEYPQKEELKRGPERRRKEGKVRKMRDNRASGGVQQKEDLDIRRCPTKGRSREREEDLEGKASLEGKQG